MEISVSYGPRNGNYYFVFSVHFFFLEMNYSFIVDYSEKSINKETVPVQFQCLTLLRKSLRAQLI